MKNCLTCRHEPTDWDQEAPDAPMTGYCRVPVPFWADEAIQYLGSGNPRGYAEVSIERGVMKAVYEKGKRKCLAWEAKP